MSVLQSAIRSRHLLLFDGECGICSKSAEFCEQIDSLERFEIAPYQNATETFLAQYGMTLEKCQQGLLVITAEGRVHQGAFAVNYFLCHQKLWWMLIVPLYLFPPLLLAEMLVYRVIATNRKRLSQWLGLTACRINRP